MNHRELVGQIRYQLSTMRERNEHHHFEDLCRRFARLRISRNILPATGPASAGGDQGRDFETFRTYLESKLPESSTFVGVGNTSEAIAFACTTQLQQNGLARKILADVAKITSSGTTVDAIYYFSTEGIPVAQRHRLQQSTYDQHEVHLEIIDVVALSEQLAMPDAFFIANEYLSIPADYYPKPSSQEHASWYQTARDEWSTAERAPFTYSDFTELKLAVREASHDESLYPDVPFWTEKLRALISDDQPLKLRLQSIYEVAVGLLLSQKDMTSETDNLVLYFTSVIDIPDDDIPTDLLSDASVLLTFSSVAVEAHDVGLSHSHVEHWHKELLKKTDRNLKRTRSGNMRCDLLQAKAQLSMIESFADGSFPGDKAFEVWLELAKAAESAPLFPLDRFANFISESAPHLGKHPRYRDLTNSVDALVEARAGSRAAAEKCRDRAQAFYSDGDILAAISEYHDAKVKWYSRETIVPSLVSIMTISGYYEELGLYYAAKHYMLAAASLAHWSDVPEAKRMVSSAIAQVALLDYGLGNWASVPQTAELAARVHGEYVGDYSRDPGDRLETSLRASASVLAAIQHIEVEVPEGRLFDLPVLNQLGLAEFQAKAEEAFTRSGIDELREMTAGDTFGFPFGDLDRWVETVWHALGIKWHATWINDFDTTIAAEQLLSSLQVMIVDLARDDLHVLPAEISMVIKKESVDLPEFYRAYDGASDPWIVILPNTRIEDSQTDRVDDELLLALCFEMIGRISVLPDDRLTEIMEQSFKRGISNKLFVAKSYSELYCDFRSREDLDHLPRLKAQKPNDPPTFPDEHPALAATKGLSLLYSMEASQQAISNRYKHVQLEIPVTLTRLSTSASFQETLSFLRQNGWKDWHVLQAIANVFFNFHTQDWIRAGMHPDEVGRRLGRLRQDQTELTNLEISSPVPLERFSADRLQMMLSMSIGATMRGIGLQLNDERIDVGSIVDFMGDRFNFWEDDVEHTDPFAPAPPGIILPV